MVNKLIPDTNNHDSTAWLT